jgi:hypothetical protein
MVNTSGEAKEKPNRKKGREKKVGKRKLDLTKVKIAFQFPSVPQQLMIHR